MPWIGDLLYALALWLKTTPLSDLAVWLSKTPLSALVDSSIWIAPIVQTTHILAIAGTFVSVLMICLRIFRLAGRPGDMAQAVARFAPWIWWGLLVLLATGLILIIGEPARELLNPAFWTKMALVVVAALIALGFQDQVRRHAAQWSLEPHGAPAIRAGAVGVMVLWCVIIMLGRWIAYAPT
jgi:hypothetical protein